MPASSSLVGRMLAKITLLSLPFLVILLSYVALDPFWVLYHYQTFSDHLITIPNRDYISTQMYLNTYQQRQYKSFILGNSRTLAFHVRDWNRYLGDTTSFHYDASGESLYGVWQKLRFLDQHSPGIKNALIVCDAELLKATKDVETHIGRKDPRVTGELPFSFQLSFFKAYLSNLFYYKYVKYRLTGVRTADLEGMLESRRLYYDPHTNDLSLPDIEQEIRVDSAGYYARNKRLTPRPPAPAVSPSVLGAAQQQQLVAIQNIFKHNRTAYQFVISPLYNQRQLNPADLQILERIFGAQHIHDFSGVNEFTREVGNYYEDSHYRPSVGRKILKLIYAPDKNGAELPK
jgi:hypothetical protein